MGTLAITTLSPFLGPENSGGMLSYVYMTIKDEATSFGQLGGRANVKKNGKSHMSKIGKKGAKARWAKSKLPK